MDTNTLERAQRGDGRAFAGLVECHYRTVYGVAFSTVGDWSAAEDIAQETFLVAWKNLPGLCKPAAFGIWLRKIARNLSRNWLRSLSYRRQLEARQRELASAETSGKEDVGQQAERKEQRAEIWDALGALSPPLREVVVLYYLEGRSVREVAQCLDCAPSAVKKRLERARPKLRAYFEARWEAEFENERKRLQPPDAAKRFLAGMALGPVQASLGNAAAGSGFLGLWGHGLAHGELPSLIKSSAAGGLKLSGATLAVSGACALLIGAVAVSLVYQSTPSNMDGRAPALVADEAGADLSTHPRAAAIEPTAPEIGGAGQPAPVAAGAVVTAPSAAAVLTPAKAEETIRIAGFVLDENGAPLPKTTVTVVTGLPPAPQLVGSSSGNMAVPPITRSPSLRLADGYAWPLEAHTGDGNSYSTICDAAGAFALDVVPGGARTIVAAWAEGYMPESVSFDLAASRKADAMSIALATCVTLNGEVLNARGAPVAGATVDPASLAWSEVNDSGARIGGGMMSPHISCAANDHGGFSLPVARPGILAVRVESEAEGEAVFGDIAVEPGVRITLQYPVPAVVCGRILRSDGSPAEACEVILSRNNMSALAIPQDDPSEGGSGYGGGGGAIGSGARKHTARVSADGTYRVERLDPTQSYLAAVADERGQLLAQGVALEALTPGLTLTWNYRLQPPIAVSGTVRDASTNKPLAGVTILCRKATGTMSPGMARPEITTTGADGTYALRVATGPGSYEIVPSFDRNGSFPAPEDAFAQAIELGANGAAQVDVLLPSPHTRSFLVVDRDGRAVPGCVIDVREHDDDLSRSWRYREVTDADGRVTVKGLAPGVPLECIFLHEATGDSGSSLLYEGEPGEVAQEETVRLVPEPAGR